METISSPWGTALTIQELVEGIFWVETAEHGGLLIETVQARTLLNERALSFGQPWDHFLAYEQDCAMAVVFYEHPEWYPWAEEELTKKVAADSLHRTLPTYFDESVPCAPENNPLASMLSR